MKKKVILIISMMMTMLIFFMPIKAIAASPAATLTIDGGVPINCTSVQDAVDRVEKSTIGSNFVIEVAAGTVSDEIKIEQQIGKNLTIQPQQNAVVTFTNTISIDGMTHFYDAAGVLLQGLNFDMTKSSSDNCINLTLFVDTRNHHYCHNITVNNCHFKGLKGTTVGVQSSAGGMRNIAITNCTATGMHSLAQLKAVSGYALVQNCILTNSEGGVNFYGPASLVIDNCQFSVDNYAVRSGQSGTTGKSKNDGSVIINNSILQSSLDKDGLVVLRNDSSENISIAHSILKANAENGIVIQNLTADNTSSYRISISESDYWGDFKDINDKTIRVIDDPEVPNGPIHLSPQPEPDCEWTVVLICVITILLITLAVVATFLIITLRRYRCCLKKCCRCKKHKRC